MFTVHVRASDAATGRPIPARLRLRAAGRTFAPLGRGPGADPGGRVGDSYHIDGGCEAQLPAGQVRISLSRGPEWRANEREVALGHGQMALRLSLERVFDWRERGWYPGDCRAHDLSPHAARLEGRAEGLSVVNLLIRESQGQAANLLAFSGETPCLPGEECLVAVNTLNEHPVLGTVSLLNCHRPVFPLRAGHSLEEWSVRDWCGQCHRKKGLVVWPGGPGQGEALACLILGEIDAFEIGPSLDTWSLYHRLLQCGVRATLVGSSGKDSGEQALGSVRTYARCPDGLSLPSWIQAVRYGHTFWTKGPLLDFSMSGNRLRAEARAVLPFERLEILADGAVLASTTGNELECAADPGTGWVAARCVGPGTLAHSSPAWIGPPRRLTDEDYGPLRDELDATSSWAATLPDKGRDALRETVRAALAVLDGRRG